VIPPEAVVPQWARRSPLTIWVPCQARVLGLERCGRGKASSPAKLIPAVEMAAARHSDIAALRAKADDLTCGLTSRKVMDRARVCSSICDCPLPMPPDGSTTRQPSRTSPSRESLRRDRRAVQENLTALSRAGPATTTDLASDDQPGLLAVR